MDTTIYKLYELYQTDIYCKDSARNNVFIGAHPLIVLTVLVSKQERMVEIWSLELILLLYTNI